MIRRSGLGTTAKIKTRAVCRETWESHEFKKREGSRSILEKTLKVHIV